MLFLSLSTRIAVGAEQLKIGTLPAADAVLLYAAKEDGVFEAHDLQVELVPFQSALELGAAMRAGTLDGHFGDIINVLMQNENGVPQMIVATTSYAEPASRYFGIAVSPRSSAQSLEELNGKSCAIGRATIVEFLLDTLLKKQTGEIVLNKQDIRQIPVRLQMLLSGQIESALLPEPLLSMVEGQGARVLVDDRKLDISLAVIAFRIPAVMPDDNFIARVKKFRLALQEEAERINREPEKYKTLMQKFRLLSPQAAEHYSMLHFSAPYTPLGIPSEECLQTYAEWMRANHILKRAVPAYQTLVFQE
jgi:NitT/TauT family transport system substrate-binding protein